VDAYPGMSGGPILDEQGKLIGIHGRAITRPDTKAITVYGIPLKTYLRLASSTPPPQSRTPSQTVQPFQSSIPNTLETKNLVEVLNTNGSFTTLIKVLKAGGLTEILRGKGLFTIFAPTDDAFASLPSDAMRDLLKPGNKPLLVKILTYHIVNDKILSKDLKSGQITSLQGDSITIKNFSNTLMVNDANVTKADIQSSNGVIHQINTLILPPSL